MKKLILLFTILACSVLASYGQKIVTAAQVNGIWRNGKDEIRIAALGAGKLKVEYAGVYETGNNANVGEAKGFAMIEGTTAMFTRAENEDCKMTLKFVGTKLIVKNEGCKFGLNVDSSGTYKKVSSKKPNFDW